jgi:hypothetical protein
MPYTLRRCWAVNRSGYNSLQTTTVQTMHCLKVTDVAYETNINEVGSFTVFKV